VSWTSGHPGPERQIFGLDDRVLAAIGSRCDLAVRVEPDRWRWVSLALFVVACIFRLGSVIAYIGLGRHRRRHADFGNRRVQPITVASSRFWAVCRASVGAAAWHERSALAFYLVAAGFLSCAASARAHFLGRTILYKPPYAW